MSPQDLQMTTITTNSHKITNLAKKSIMTNEYQNQSVN
jgi:hypothetical protein